MFQVLISEAKSYMYYELPSITEQHNCVVKIKYDPKQPLWIWFCVSEHLIQVDKKLREIYVVIFEVSRVELILSGLKVCHLWYDALV